MKQNKKAFSLLVAVWTIILVSMIAIFILDFIVPFSRNIKWIENASSAYYQANSWIEEALWDVTQSWALNDIPASTIAGSAWKTFSIDAKWQNLPPLWEWNSEFDANFNWNTIWQWEPIQLEIWDNIISNWANFNLYLRVPNLDKILSSWESLIWSNNIVNWQLTSTSDALNSDDSSLIDVSEINSSDTPDSSLNRINFSSLWGIRLNWNTQNFQAFYSSNCGVWNRCILKLSIIDDLDLGSNKIAPFLEWKIESNDEILLRYSIAESTWISFGFKKDLKIRIPQTTVNEAFDFTIFQ